MTSFPDKQTFFAAADVLVDAGATMIECGIPFSDPSADGPYLTGINHRMAEFHHPMQYYLSCIAELQSHHPQLRICVMCYLNPIFRYGMGNYTKYLADNGIFSILIPDLPVEEYDSFIDSVDPRIRLACIVSDNMNDDMLARCLYRATGFVYVMSSVTTTGSETDFFPGLRGLVERLSRLDSDKQLIVGFGIKTRDHILKLKTLDIDGFIIGSEIVRHLDVGGILGLREYIVSLSMILP